MVEDLRFSGLSTLSKLARRAAKVSMSDAMVRQCRQKQVDPKDRINMSGLFVEVGEFVGVDAVCLVCLLRLLCKRACT